MSELTATGGGVEPWTAVQKRHVALAAIAIVFDGIDNQLLGFATPSIMAEWDVSKADMAPVSAVGLVGMVVGAIAGGALGDLYGRRAMLIASMVLFGGMTVVAGLADGLGWLGFARFATGLGLGGALPNATAFAADATPLRLRPWAITLTIVCVPIGGLIAGLLARQILPAAGWRELFVIAGGLSLLAAVFLWRTLPESATFVRTTGNGSLRALFDRDLARDTCLLWVAMFACLFAVYAVNAWAPTMLGEAGFSAATATDGLSAFNLGGIGGGILTAWFILRHGSRRALMTSSAGAAGVALAAGLWVIDGQDPALVVAAFALMGLAVHGTQTTLFAVAAHVYPDRVRAAGVGAAVGIGRFGAVLSAFAGAAALGVGGGAAFLALVAAAMACVFLALSLLQRHVPPPR